MTAVHWGLTEELGSLRHSLTLLCLNSLIKRTPNEYLSFENVFDYKFFFSILVLVIGTTRLTEAARCGGRTRRCTASSPSLGLRSESRVYIFSVLLFFIYFCFHTFHSIFVSHNFFLQTWINITSQLQVWCCSLTRKSRLTS